MNTPVTSIVGGSPATGVRTVPSTNPAKLDELVGELKAAADRGEGNPLHGGDGK